MRTLLLLLTIVLLAACGQATNTQTNRTERFTVALSFDSVKAGSRIIGISVTDPSGKPVQADLVVIAPVMLDMGMASPEMPAVPAGPGRYEARGEPFSMVGKWQIDVRITADGKQDTTSFLVDITP